MTVKKTKKLNTVSQVSNIASNQTLLMTDSNGAVTRISLADLKKSILGSIDLNIMNEGIFIMYHKKSGDFPLMVKPHLWPSIQNTGEIADGVVVVEGSHLLVVAPTETSVPLLWSHTGVNSGGITTTDRLTAFGDWAGKTSTDEQVKHAECQGNSFAPGFCHGYSRVNVNGKGLTAGRWWLPSLGEIMMIYANMSKINYALSLIKGSHPLKSAAYWTSTEASGNLAWYIYFNNGDAYYYTKAAGKHLVRPVSAILR